MPDLPPPAQHDAPPRLTLAIETANPGSGVGGGVALGLVHPGNPAGTQLIAAEPLREVDRDRDDLIPAIERLLSATNKTRTDLQQIAVSVGPGGFTSTRVACATGAMLAEGLGIPTVAVPSALAAVLHHKAQSADQSNNGLVAVLMASKGDAAWFAAVPLALNGAASLTARSGTMTTSPDVIITRPTAALADAHLPAAFRSALEAAGIQVYPLTFSPAACLQAAALCEPGDPATLVPIYPREPEAVTLWRSRHGPAQPPSPDSGATPARADTPSR